GRVSHDLGDTLTKRLGPKAFEAAGIGPEDIDIIEVHDATSPSEIITLIELGIIRGEDAPRCIDEGWLEPNRKMKYEMVRNIPVMLCRSTAISNRIKG
ncbi:MAG: hypothetical protein R6W71_03185, partial [Bacteroidales bacterium]